MGRSAIEQDYATMADFTHPKLIEMTGGRDAYIKLLNSTITDLKNRGFGIRKYTLGEPSKPSHASGEVYAVVPSEIEMSGPGGAKGRKRSYLIAVSDDDGANWKFIDGEGIGDDRTKLKTVFPNFPDEIALTARQKTEWER